MFLTAQNRDLTMERKQYFKCTDCFFFQQASKALLKTSETNYMRDTFHCDELKVTRAT